MTYKLKFLVEPLVPPPGANSQCHHQNSCPVAEHEKRDAKECSQKKSGTCKYCSS